MSMTRPVARLETDRAYRAANRKKIAAMRRANYIANREKILAQRKSNYVANRETILAQRKASRVTNREYLRAYRVANREKIAAQRKASRVRPARLKSPLPLPDYFPIARARVAAAPLRHWRSPADSGKDILILGSLWLAGWT